MKRIAIVCALMCIIGSTVMSAQNKGDMYISGSIGMSGPQFGYFIIDNLEIHLGLAYDYTKVPFGSTERTNTNMFFIQPGANYYLNVFDNRFFYTPGLDLGIGFGGRNYKTDNTKVKEANITQFSISLQLLSFEFRPVDNFGISFRAGDTYTFKQEADPTDKSFKTNTNSFNFGLNLSSTLGFRYYF